MSVKYSVKKMQSNRDTSYKDINACNGGPNLRGCQTIDKVGQLLRAWFSCRGKSADKIVEPRHTADFIVCNFVRYQLASQIHNSRMQIAK